ncbi:MAG TPA: DNA repair protein RecO [Rhabdochlamydiaceae bacterium]|nr:DNA repair protein RecO [Rhabdochlamydiaceae bacterium]
MKEENSEAIVLRSFDYQEHQRIITLFTPDSGLIQLIVKGINQKNLHLFSLTTVFCRGHYHFIRGRSDLYRYLDGSCLELLPLRDNLIHLRAAASITKALLHSQLPGKPSPRLYALTLAYLKQIPLFDDPAPLVVSYQLKLLKHDGLTHLRAPCSLCANEASHLNKGQALCLSHAVPDSFFFTHHEWSTLIELQDSRQFESLKQVAIGPHLQEKIENYFSNRIRQFV